MNIRPDNIAEFAFGPYIRVGIGHLVTRVDINFAMLTWYALYNLRRKFVNTIALKLTLNATPNR